MKQNERLLVYVVTGFLALILVVAVVFSREPGKGAPGSKPQNLDQIFAGDRGGTAVADKTTKEKVALDGNRTGLPKPDEVTPQQPLVAPKPMLAADLVVQQLGASRRDRSVRMVRAKQGDSLDQLVRRWCGARDPFLGEAKSLNEDLVVLRVGQEVAVPWVDDEEVLAGLEAQKPRTLLLTDAVASPATGLPAPAASNRPDFSLPGSTAGSTVGGAVGTRTPALGAGTSYTIKSGDSLWRIAERTYGRKNADRMLPVIKEANPGLTDRLKPGQQIVLPADSGGGA